MRERVSQDDRQPTSNAGESPEPEVTAPATDESIPNLTLAEVTPSTSSDTGAPDPKGDENPDDTVGTGTSIALGCVAGTILLIIIGLIFLGIAALF